MLSNRYLPLVLSPNAALRLIALPYAGGGAAMYYQWRRAMPSRTEIVPLSLPGREARTQEQPLTNLHQLVGEITDELRPTIDRPFALLGHSLGALIAFELARELRRRGERLPCLLIAAASSAPHRPRLTEPLHKLAEDQFVAEIERRFGGIPPAIRENKELLELFLPTMRADLELLETYQYRDERPLETDILAIGGAADNAVSAAELSDWRRHSSKRFSHRLLPGGHFFLFQKGERGTPEPPAAVPMIVGQLERYLGTQEDADPCS